MKIFFLVEAIGCRRICVLVSKVSDLSTTSCFFLFFEFSHYGGIGHKQKVAKMIDRKFMDFIWVLQFFDTNLDFAGSKANQCRSFLHG